MFKQSVVRLLISTFLLILSVMSAHSYYDGSELGYLDYVTVNDQEFDNFDERQIVFYPEDLRDGRVVIRGLLESEKKEIPVDQLQVQITMDGGETWTAAEGSSRWEFQFRPELERTYDLSIRVVQNSAGDTRDQLQNLLGSLWEIGDFELRTQAQAELDRLTGEGSIALGWLGSYLPERLRAQGSGELKVQFENLQIEAQKIVGGEIQVATKQSLQLPWAELRLDKIIFSSSGAHLEGSVQLDFEGVNLPELPLDDISLGLAGLKGEFSVTNVGNPLQLVLLEGTYGVSLILDSLVLGVDSAQQVPLTINDLAGSVLLGSGYGNLQIPDLSMLADQSIAWGLAAAAHGQEVAATVLTIPRTDFKLRDIGGSINLKERSLSLNGKFQLPDQLGGGSVSLPAETPLVLSAKGISTSGTLQFDAGTLPAVDLSGFPTSLSSLSLAIADNIPSGSLAGQVVLTSFADLPLDITADISRDGLEHLRMATEKETYSFILADFATLSLSKLVLEYGAGDLSVELDGAITPTNSMVSSVTGLGDALVFEGLSIAKDAISLANSMSGWHELSGASAEIEGARLSLSQYGVGVDDNKFWLGLKGSGSLAGASVSATARVFHDGTTEISGIDLDKLYFSLGEFALKIERSAISEAGTVAEGAVGAILGLPALMQEKLPALFNRDGELLVQLNGLQVDLANRQVSLGAVSLTPQAPLAFDIGPVTMQLSAMTFSSSRASIDGAISLAGIGLPLTDLPFADLGLGRDGFAGQIDLVGLLGTLDVPIVEGEFGFGLNLTQLKVDIDTGLALEQMFKLTDFSGSLQLGSGYGDLSIPDLQLLADQSIAWGHNQAAGLSGGLGRLQIPGTMFQIDQPGGQIDLASKELSLSGTLLLPPALGSASITIPANQPLRLSHSGISSAGNFSFSEGNLPQIAIEALETKLDSLNLSISDNILSGSLSGQLLLPKLADLAIDISAGINGLGLTELKVGKDDINKTVSIRNFAEFTLSKASGGYQDDHFYVELDGSIKATHSLFSDFGKTVSFSGMRVFRNAIMFMGDQSGWHSLDGVDVDINSLTLALTDYGLGIEGNKLWFGLQGKGSFGGNSVDATAKIYQDGSYAISGLELDGLKLALGDFVLRTSAKIEEGTLSGAGFINPGFLTSYLPEEFCDPVTGEIPVEFIDLGVDFEDKKITSGEIVVTLPGGVSLDWELFEVQLSQLRFGIGSASVKGSFALKGFQGLSLPEVSSPIQITDMSFSPSGLKGIVRYSDTQNPLLLPVVTGDYGLALQLSVLELTLDTRKSDLLKMLTLTDLQGAVKLGSGYNLDDAIDGLKLLSDRSIAWGQARAGELEDVGQQLKEGLSFTIPRTNFQLMGVTGRVNLVAKEVRLRGDLQLPPSLGSISVSMPEGTALVLSSAGLSTEGQLVFDTGSLGEQTLAGLRSRLSSLALGVTDNLISGAAEATLYMESFDNLPVQVAIEIASKGIEGLTVASEKMDQQFDIVGFANLSLSAIRGGYEDGDFFVDLDGELTINNNAISDLERSFAFNGLKIGKDLLELAEDVEGWHRLDDVALGVNALQLSLIKYGFGIDNNRLWVGLQGQVVFNGSEATATAKVYHTKEFELTGLGFEDLLISCGDFHIRTSAQVVDGMISDATGFLNLGGLMDDIPAGFKDPDTGELPIQIRNVGIDTSGDYPTLSSGSVRFMAPFTISNDYILAAINGIEVGVNANGAPFGKIIGGNLELKSLPKVPALSDLSLANLSINSDGFSGDLTWSGTQNLTLWDHPQFGIDASLNSLTLTFNSTASSWSEKITLSQLSGTLNFGAGYNTTMTPALSLAGDLYSFVGDSAAGFTLPGTNLRASAISGAIRIGSDAQLNLSGLLEIPYEETLVAFAFDGLAISASGMDGTVGIAEPLPLTAFDFPAVLTEAGVTFSGWSLEHGSVGLDVTLEQFLDLEVGIKASLSTAGIESWSMKAAAQGAYSLDVSFATLTVTDPGVGYGSGGMFFSLATDVAIDEESIIGAVAEEINLSGIQVYADDLMIDAAEMERSFSGATASLGGLSLSLTTLGIGYDNDIFLKVGGTISIADLCDGGVTLRMFRTKPPELEQIAIAYDNPVFGFTGSLELTDNAFAAELDVNVAEMIKATGYLEVGQVVGDSGYVYWSVGFVAGMNIPLTGLPMNIYGLGGGAAYNMTVKVVNKEASFVKAKGAGLALTASSHLGTPDNGYTWFGEFDLHMEPQKLKLTLEGRSWFLTGKSASGDPHLQARLQLGADPAFIQVSARARMTEEVADLTMIDVNGQVDLLFSAHDWHIYFGSRDQRLQVTALEFLKGQGYVGIDSSGLGMGVMYSFDLEGSAWIFYGRIYGGAAIDLRANIVPFYVDVRGRLWIGLEAGVEVSDERYEIFGAYAELAAQFRAPNPTFVKLHGKMSYSLLGGIVSGTWKMDFYLPKSAKAAAEDISVTDIPLLTYTVPAEGATDVSRLVELSVQTTLPINKAVRLDDGNWYMLAVKDKQYEGNFIVDMNDQQAVQDRVLKLRNVATNSAFGGLFGGLADDTELRYHPPRALPAETEYRFDTTLQLWSFRPAEPVDEYTMMLDASQGEIMRIMKEEVVERTFRTTKTEPRLSSFIKEVYPLKTTKPVYPDTDIYIVFQTELEGFVIGYAGNFRLLDPAGNEVPGHWELKFLTENDQDGTRRFAKRFIPDQPLKQIELVENLLTGEIKPVNADGSNPFLPREEGPVDESVQLATGPLSHKKKIEKQRVQSVESQPRVATNSPVVNKSGAGSDGLTVVDSSGLGLAETPQPGDLSVGAAGSYQEIVANPGSIDLQQGQIGIAETPGATIDQRFKFTVGTEYRIEILNDDKLEYQSVFELTPAAKGSSETNSYASQGAMINQSITSAMAFVNFSVDQERYKSQAAEAYTTLVSDEIVRLFENHFLTGGFYRAGGWPGCQAPASPRDLETEAAGLMPDKWSAVQPLSTTVKAGIYRVAMQDCAAAQESIEEATQRYDARREALLNDNRTVDFQSLEVRFNTAGTLNWHDLELKIDIKPTFFNTESTIRQEKERYAREANRGKVLQCAMEKAGLGGNVQLYVDECLQIQVEKRWAEMEQKIAKTAYLFKAGEYVVRSRPETTDHKLELRANDSERFSGKNLGEWIDTNAFYQSRVSGMGEVSIYRRRLTDNNSEVSGQEWSLQQSELIKTIPIRGITSTRGNNRPFANAGGH